MKLWILIAAVGSGLLLSASEPTISAEKVEWARSGHSWFESAEFGRAARSFERAVAVTPDDAGLHNWLGKSYARMAETASPLHARRDALRAERSLMNAVRLEPRNQEYLRDLFEFYVDSPEWVDGGLRKAEQLQERLESGRDTTGSLKAAREEYRGGTWWFRKLILRSSGAVSRVLP